MSTLAIDTATADTVAGVVRGGEPPIERRIGPGADGRPRHGPALLGLVAEVVEEAGGWPAIERIGVGVGPGSFTGVRIGVATARGLAQARGLPIAAVPSTAALAAGISATGADGLERPEGRELVAVIDARRGEVFAARIGPGESQAGPPELAAPEALSDVLQLGSGALAAGDGAVRFRGELEAAGIEVLADDDPAHRISARHVGAIAESLEAAGTEDVRPLYLRRPDAERWRKRDGRD